MDTEKLIEILHRNKHNSIPVVKRAIAKPLYAILDKDCTTNYLPDSVKKEALSRKPDVDGIMEYLSSIGSVQDGNPEHPLTQLREQVDYVKNTIVPKIKDLAEFYGSGIDNDIYFCDTEDGESAKSLVRKAKDRCEIACKCLLELDRVDDDSNASFDQVNLCGILQDVFDVELKSAVVEYPSSDSDRAVFVSIDKSLFTKVLDILADNFNRHAFPEEPNKFVTDKKVSIRFESNSNVINIHISNNGNPFKGDESKLFNYGFHSGLTGNTGYGLCSAKEIMKKMGGDITLGTPPDGHNISFVVSINK